MASKDITQLVKKAISYFKEAIHGVESLDENLLKDLVTFTIYKSSSGQRWLILNTSQIHILK